MHFAVLVVHGAAHYHLSIGVSTWQKAFIAVIIFAVPLIATMMLWTRVRKFILSDRKLSPFLLPVYLPQLERNVNHGQANRCMFSMTAITPLSAAHVPILAGTDLGNSGTAPGASLHWELEYLVEAGLTPTQALVAANIGDRYSV
jgi:imidazolonepropionase-like amidohydrolase